MRNCIRWRLVRRSCVCAMTFSTFESYIVLFDCLTGWEIPFPKEEIQAIAAGARHQTSGDRSGRTDTSEPQQNTVRCTVGGDGRLDLLSSPEGTSGWTDVMWRDRKCRRGELKLFFSISKQRWFNINTGVLKCNFLNLPSTQHAMFTLHENDAFTSKQGRLC